MAWQRASKHACVHSRAQRHRLHRRHRPARVDAKQVGDQLAHRRHLRGTPHQDHLRERLPSREVGSLAARQERLRRAPRLRRPLLCWRRRRRLPWQRHCGSERNLVKRRLEPLQQRLARSLHRVAGQLDRGAFAALAAALTVARRRRLRRREEDRDALDDRELALRRLGALAQSAQRGLVVVDGGEGEPPPLREEERDDGGVEVCPAEERVPRGGEHLGLGLGTG
mmetsp:Transcript_6591/g.19073  ORF Transcript_6591/g.19073 Transcript_6591/m.19073 type:complete len:225 (+) Transcript_6591:184-858(+)